MALPKSDPKTALLNLRVLDEAVIDDLSDRFQGMLDRAEGAIESLESFLQQAAATQSEAGPVIGDLDGRLGLASRVLKALSQESAKVEGVLENLGEARQNHDAAEERLTNRIDSVNTDLDVAETSLHETQEAMGAQHEHAVKLDGDVVQLRDELFDDGQAYESARDALDERSTALHGQMDSLGAQVENLQSDCGAVGDQVTAMREDVAKSSELFAAGRADAEQMLENLTDAIADHRAAIGRELEDLEERRRTSQEATVRLESGLQQYRAEFSAAVVYLQTHKHDIEERCIGFGTYLDDVEQTVDRLAERLAGQSSRQDELDTTIQTRIDDATEQLAARIKSARTDIEPLVEQLETVQSGAAASAAEAERLLNTLRERSVEAETRVDDRAQELLALRDDTEIGLQDLRERVSTATREMAWSERELRKAARQMDAHNESMDQRAHQVYEDLARSARHYKDLDASVAQRVLTARRLFKRTARRLQERIDRHWESTDQELQPSLQALQGHEERIARLYTEIESRTVASDERIESVFIEIRMRLRDAHHSIQEQQKQLCEQAQNLEQRLDVAGTTATELEGLRNAIGESQSVFGELSDRVRLLTEDADARLQTHRQMAAAEVEAVRREADRVRKRLDSAADALLKEITPALQQVESNTHDVQDLASQIEVRDLEQQRKMQPLLDLADRFDEGQKDNEASFRSIREQFVEQQVAVEDRIDTATDAILTQITPALEQVEQDKHRVRDLATRVSARELELQRKLQTKLQSFEEQHVSMERRIDQLHDRTTDLARLREHLIGLQKSFADLQDDSKGSAAMLETTELRSELQARCTELQQLETRFDALHAAVGTLRDEQSTRNSIEDMSALQERLERRDRELQQHRVQLDSLQSAFEALRDGEQASPDNGELDDLRAQLQERSAHLVQLDERFTTLHTDVDAMREETTAYGKAEDVSALQERLGRRDRELQQLWQRLDALQAAFKETRSDQTSLAADDLVSLRTQLLGVTDQLDQRCSDLAERSEHDREDLLEQLGALRTQADALVTESGNWSHIEDAEVLRARVDSMYERLGRERQSLMSSIEQRCQSISEQSTHGLDALKKHLGDLQTQVASLAKGPGAPGNDAQGNLQAQVFALTSRFEKAISMVQSGREVQSALTMRVDQLQGQLDEVDQTLNLLPDPASVVVAPGNNSNDRDTVPPLSVDPALQEQLRAVALRFETTIEQVHAYRTGAESSRASLEQQMNNVQREIDELARDVDERIGGMQLALSGQVEAATARSEAASTMGAHIASIQSTVGQVLDRVEDRIEPAINKLETRKHQAEDTVERIEAQFGDLQSQVSALLGRMSSMPSAPPSQPVTAVAVGAPASPESESIVDITEGSLRAFIATVNAHDEPRTQEFIERHYAATAQADVTTDERLEVYRILHDQTGGIEFRHARAVGPVEVVMVAQAKVNGEWSSYTFQFDPADRHRILRVYIDPIEESDARGMMS